MPARILNEVMNLRYEFTRDERLEMATNLANAYNSKNQIDEEEASMRGQIKERRAAVEATVGSLSRSLSNQFEMRNVRCELLYDAPNVGEVSYRRSDNGEIVKVRPMNDAERQMDLPLDTMDQVLDSIEQSSKAADAFFKPPSEGAEAPPAHPEPPVDWQGSQEEYEASLKPDTPLPAPDSSAPKKRAGKIKKA